MTTPTQQKIRDKKRTPGQIANMIKRGEWITNGSVGEDPKACMEALAGRLGDGPSDLQDIEIWNYGTFYPQRPFQEVDPLQRYHCFHDYFFFPWNRQARDAHGLTSWAQWGWTIGSWWHHYRFAHGDPARRGIDWCFNAATPVDGNGFLQLVLRHQQLQDLPRSGQKARRRGP